MKKEDMFEKDTDEMEGKEVKAIKFNINYKLAGTVAAVVGVAYVMGAVKGIEIGKRMGEAKGYDKAITEIGKVVKEARKSVEK